MAASREVLELAVVNPRWQPTWLVLPWFLGIGGIIMAHARFADEEAAALGERVRQMTVLCAVSSAVKLLALWDLPTYFLPFITFLWSPHCTWALGLSWLLYLHLPSVQRGDKKTLTPVRASLIALAIALPVYGAYTFYFCQVTLLHGDEGQYLRVTQSLLRDGDMDLTNNLDDHHIAEFHNLRFDVHKASSSPPGKLYSVHPIGLSVLLMPFYELGLSWWGNPRLTCALAMAAIAAGCVSLCLLWLLRLGTRPWVAWTSTTILALSAPLFPFSNQLFPDVPALVIFLALLAATALAETRGRLSPPEGTGTAMDRDTGGALDCASVPPPAVRTHRPWRRRAYHPADMVLAEAKSRLGHPGNRGVLRTLRDRLLQLRFQRRLDGSVSARQRVGRGCAQSFHLVRFASGPLVPRAQRHRKFLPDIPFEPGRVGHSRARP